MDKRLHLLNNLMCFEVAARHQSYSKAAEELFISQSAVSQQMRQLEQQLEVQLFMRQGRKMFLTREGETLCKACQSGFSSILNGLNAIKNEGIAGDLIVSSTQAFCALWLMPRIYQFSQVHPEININVQGSNQVADLQQSQVDVAIRFSTDTEKLRQPPLVVEHICDDEVFPVISTQLAQKLKIETHADFLKCRLIGLVNETEMNWQNWFAAFGVNGNVPSTLRTEVTSSDLALSAVLSGHGAMLASKRMVGHYIQSGQLISPFKQGHPNSWKTHLVYLKDSPKNARVKIFCDWVKEQMLLE